MGAGGATPTAKRGSLLSDARLRRFSETVVAVHSQWFTWRQDGWAEPTSSPVYRIVKVCQGYIGARSPCDITGSYSEVTLDRIHRFIEDQANRTEPIGLFAASR